MRAPAVVRQDFEPPRAFDATALNEPIQYMLSTFPVEKALKEELSRTLWSQNFTAAMDSIDKHERDVGVGRYPSTNELLIFVMEEDESTARFTKHRSLLDFYTGAVVAAMYIGDVSGERDSMPNTSGRFLLTRKGCPVQCGHNDFAVRYDKSSAYFLIVTGSESSNLAVRYVSSVCTLYGSREDEAGCVVDSGKDGDSHVLNVLWAQLIVTPWDMAAW